MLTFGLAEQREDMVAGWSHNLHHGATRDIKAKIDGLYNRIPP